MTTAKLNFLIIDPQNDFCDPRGSLFVHGADKDSSKLSGTILRLKDKIENVYVTLDTHHLVDIAHPIFWIDASGCHPSAFTVITSDDLKNGIWRTTDPRHMQRAADYVEALRTNGRYSLCIWPPHCLIGSWGNNVVKPVYDALFEWESGFKVVNYMLKGTNIWTEHYSAVKAEVEDPDDPKTRINAELIRAVQSADVTAVSGQALSHCVANTIRDIASELKDDVLKKIVLLTDTTSPVAGFEGMATDFVEEMARRGMRLCRADDFMR